MHGRITHLTTVLAAVAMLFACGGAGGGTTAATPSQGPVSLSIGVVPVIDVAPIYLGIKKGFFTKQQLDVTPKVLSTGATVVAGVDSGKPASSRAVHCPTSPAAASWRSLPG